MEESGAAKVALATIIIAALIGLGLGVFGIARATLTEGTKDFEQLVNELDAESGNVKAESSIAETDKNHKVTVNEYTSMKEERTDSDVEAKVVIALVFLVAVGAGVFIKVINKKRETDKKLMSELQESVKINLSKEEP